MQVRSVMTGNVVTVTEEDRAWTAAELLARLDLTGLPVVDAERRVLGVVTDLDLIRALRAGGDLRATSVGAVMVRRPLFVEPETEIETAAALMDEWQVRRLPVCADGRVVGVISRGDVLRAMMLARMQT